jgi:hypothetical protein
MGREFRSSGLSQHEFAQKIRVHLVTEVRWIRTTSVEINRKRAVVNMVPNPM